jgi:hypothetical protein
MFYMEAQAKVAQSPLKTEIQEGDISIGTQQDNGGGPTGSSGGRGGRKRRGGRSS